MLIEIKLSLGGLKSLSRTLGITCLAFSSVAMTAQNSARPAPKASPSDYASRWDIFAGYSYLAPHGAVDVLQPDGVTLPFNYNAVNVGGLFSGAYYFNKWVGGQVEYGLHEWGAANPNGSNNGSKGNDDGFQTISGGIIFRFPMEDLTPFIHGLVGTALVNGPDFNPNTWGPNLTVGGGMDYATPLFEHRIAIRVFQTDYSFIHADFGPAIYGGRANINAARLSGGLVFHLGSIAPPAPPTIACSASPTTVFPDDPATVTATASGLNPKDNAIYTWSGDGVTGSGTSATVATGSLAPGTYTVKCGVKEGKPGKEGLKPWQVADASTTFTVKDFEPPTISCAANPTTINPGDNATITATAVSPQNRPLTYSYTATAGTITGSGSTATYSSAGAPSGTTDVTCNVADDKGHSATANASLTIAPPPPPPGPVPEQMRMSVTCTATPEAVRPGQRVALTVSGVGLRPGDQVSWTFSLNSTILAQEHGKGWLDTGGLSPGNYKASANITGAGEPRQCSASFTVDTHASVTQLQDITQASALLPPDFREGTGDALYSYVLSRKRPTTDDETIRLHNIVLSVLARGTVTNTIQRPVESDKGATADSILPGNQSKAQNFTDRQGIIYIPVIQAYLSCSAQSTSSCQDADEFEAHWIVEERHYDAQRAQNLLSQLACAEPNAVNSCQAQISGNGPFLLTTVIPLSKNHPNAVIIQDLAGTNPENAGQWVDKFLQVISNEQNWVGQTPSKRLLNLGAELDRAGFTLIQVGGVKSAVLAILGIKN
jgi:hypothetical protein